MNSPEKRYCLFYWSDNTNAEPGDNSGRGWWLPLTLEIKKNDMMK
jgi:hypothetical protein